MMHEASRADSPRVCEKIGGFDGRMFAYWEDVALSIRSARAGFLNAMIPHVSVLHPSKAVVTGPAAVAPHFCYFMARNEIMMWRDFVGGTALLKAIIWVLRKQVRQIGLMRDYPAAIEAVLSGLWDGMRGIGGGYDPPRPMPQPFRYMLTTYPGACQYLLGWGR